MCSNTWQLKIYLIAIRKNFPKTSPSPIQTVEKAPTIKIYLVFIMKNFQRTLPTPIQTEGNVLMIMFSTIRACETTQHWPYLIISCLFRTIEPCGQTHNRFF